MTLITRVSRLFRADLHAVLDRVEEPVALLRQAIREMEESLASDEQRSRLLQHEQSELLRRTGDLESALSETEEQLNLCFASGKEDLARALVKRKLETQRLRKFLCEKQTALRATVDRLEARLQENREALEHTRQKADLLEADDDHRNPQDSSSTPDFSLSKEDVEVAYLREKQKRRPS